MNVLDLFINGIVRHEIEENKMNYFVCSNYAGENFIKSIDITDEIIEEYTKYKTNVLFDINGDILASLCIDNDDDFFNETIETIKKIYLLNIFNGCKFYNEIHYIGNVNNDVIITKDNETSKYILYDVKKGIKEILYTKKILFNYLDTNYGICERKAEKYYNYDFKEYLKNSTLSDFHKMVNYKDLNIMKKIFN